MLTLPPFPDTAWRGPFAQYRAIVEPVTVTPLPYHFGNLLALLSAQIGDIAVLDEGVRTFLNFYVFNYGRTGTKKSTAMRLVQQHIVERLKSQSFRALSQVSSGEGLMRTVNSPPYNVLLRYDEIKHLLTIADRKGCAVEPVLNAAFDLEDLQTVVRDEKASIDSQPYFFTMSANGTPIHVTTEMGESIFKGGLLNRFFVFAAMPNGRRLKKVGNPNEGKAILLSGAIDEHVAKWRAFTTTRASVRVGMTPDAESLFDVWHERLEHEIATANELISDPIQRIGVYAKKLAGVYAFYETPVPTFTLMCDALQVQAAMDIADYCKASILFMSSAWSGIKSLGARSEALAEERMQVYLNQRGCTPERKLSHDLKMSIGETKKTVSALASVNIVTLGLDRPPTIHVVGECWCFEPEMPMQMEPEE